MMPHNKWSNKQKKIFWWKIFYGWHLRAMDLILSTTSRKAFLKIWLWVSMPIIFSRNNFQSTDSPNSLSLCCKQRAVTTLLSINFLYDLPRNMYCEWKSRKSYFKVIKVPNIWRLSGYDNHFSYQNWWNILT